MWGNSLLLDIIRQYHDKMHTIRDRMIMIIEKIAGVIAWSRLIDTDWKSEMSIEYLLAQRLLISELVFLWRVCERGCALIVEDR